MKLHYLFTLLGILLIIPIQKVKAQFAEPVFTKIEPDDVEQYRSLIDSFNLTGQNLYGETVIDEMFTLDIRAKLQGAFGDPTQTIETITKRKNFRLAQAIEFEYWFLVEDPAADGPVPLLVLDIHGPFEKGVVLGAASRYVDLMPQILRSFEKILIETRPVGFTDYYLEGDTGKWYLIQSDGIDHDVREIEKPSHIRIN